ncbi:hypothetical protein GQ568_01870 [Patescibacteria group bacterium]|nr:hypothetical protein [Patescibacteria group bacterium]
MMSIILYIILILFLIKIVRDSLYFVWLWQVKEYRIDRMRSYLRDGKDVVWKNISYYLLALWILTFFRYQTFFIFLILLFFTFTFYQILTEIKNRILKRPRFTFKVILIFFLEAIFYFSLFALYWIPASAGMTRPLALLLFLCLVTPILITAIVLFTNPFFNFQKKRIIKRAAKKMKRLKKVKVIGITGSYGKTSTKEFLYTILNQKYKVVKTEGNNNTNIGVAYTVLNKVNDDYDYFICEMGAYKIGEIKKMCEIVNPEIGILTGINEQHIDLFGSIKNTIKAKFELIESLPEDGLAIINSGIRNQELGIRVKNIKYFSLDDVSNIKVHQDCIEFDYKNQKFKINILGKHYIENILSAIITAEYLGMNLGEIKNAIEKIKSSKFMMRRLDGPNKSIFIDDSYSANPDGVMAALDYLDEAYKNYKKIIVFPGIIELGRESNEVHKKLFSRINEVCDTAYILSQSAKGLHSPKGTMEPASRCEFVFEKDFNKVAKMLNETIEYKNMETQKLQSENLSQQESQQRKTVVLFESRGAGVVMGKLL